MKQGTILGSQIGKWIILAVVVAAFAALLTASVVRAQDDSTTIEYAEDGTDAVVTLTAADPESATVYWSLPITPPTAPLVPLVGFVEADFTASDAAEFTITPTGDGAAATLNFKFPPDFETPMGGDANTNTYNVVVMASDDAPGVTGRKMEYHKVRVTVTDLDEDGTVALSALQPQVGVALTATLTDPDSRSEDARPIANETWKWEQSSAMDGPWSLIPGAGTGDTDATAGNKASDDYMPAADIAEMYLRVTVTYTDKHGDDKSAMAVSANAVRTVPSGTNSVPTFPDSTDTREVDENSPPGTLVGDPVKASDTRGETLTYGLRGTDAGDYTIDAATGQLKVGGRGLEDADTTNGAELTNSVTVWAMDASSMALESAPPTDSDDNDRASVAVTITIKNVNEAPTVSGGPTRIKHQDGSADIDPAPTYAATDPESTAQTDECTNESLGSICIWSLEGPDAADFMIGDETTGDTVFGGLAFKNTPDFENPADADMDNVYMVTVKVTDNGVDDKNKMSATRDVMITVTNANEDGSVTFSSVQPKVGRPFTATLNDPDGMTTGVTWQWWRTTNASLDTAPDFLDADPQTGNRDGWEKIADAKSDTYKPVSGDVDRWLIAMATYTDPDGSSRAMDNTSANAVIANIDNVAPEFREGGDKPVMQATRKIAENSVSDAAQGPNNPGNVGEPVAATDPNGAPDSPEGRLTHTLGGPDKDSFEIDALSGQITVGADTELDYESNKKTYMVTVTATDPSQAMTTIDVTINVTDVNEPPSFTAPGEGDVEKTVQENTRSLNIYTFPSHRPGAPEGLLVKD